VLDQWDVYGEDFRRKRSACLEEKEIEQCGE